MKSKSTFLDILYLFAKYRKTLIGISTAVFVVSVLFSLILPKWYRSYAILLPPQLESTQMNFSSFLSNLPLGALGFGSFSDETNLYLAILNSRTLVENLVKEFDLQTLYKQDNIEKTIKAARSHMRFDLNEDGTLTISMEASTGFFPNSVKEDSARQLAKRMVEFIVQELDRIYREKRTEKARFNRIYIEKRYRKNLEDLRNAEEAYQAFQQKYGAFDLPEQIKAQISLVANLQAQILSKEVEIGVLKNYYTSGHPILQQVEQELFELKKRLESLNGGATNGLLLDAQKDEKSNFLLPFSKLPELGLEYIRRYRELELQQKLLEFLLPQYEQAKIQEAKDTPVVQILDPPSLPILKSRPKRAFLVIFITFFITMLTMLYLLLKDWLNRIAESDPETAGKIQYILSGLNPRNLLKKD